MREHEAFGRFILTHPDQDAPRLLYADWLDQRGDPRAEFIRMQCALQRLPAGDARWTECQERADALLKQHEHEWIQPVRPFISGWTFRRGFVDQVLIEARQFLLHARTLFDQAPIRHVQILDIGNNVQALVDSPYLARLEALTIFASHAGDALARALALCPHLNYLRELNLGRNRISDAGVAALAASRALRSLTSLDLSENLLGEPATHYLAASTTMSQLGTLTLARNAIGSRGAWMLLESERLNRLYELRLGFNQIHLFLPIQNGPVLRRLRILDLAGNDLDGAGIAPLFESPHIRGVHTLNLNANLLADHGMQILAESPNLAGLRRLLLEDNRITDVGVRLLAASPHLTGLTTLKLTNNPIGAAGVLALQNSPLLQRANRSPGVKYE